MANNVNINGFVLDTQSFDDAFQHSFEKVGEHVEREEPDGPESFSARRLNVCVHFDNLLTVSPLEYHCHQDKYGTDYSERIIVSPSLLLVIFTKLLPYKST